MHKELKKYIVLFAFFSLISCDEKSTAESDFSVQLNSPKISNIFYGDTLVMFGTYLSKDQTKILAIQNKDTLVLDEGLTFVNNSEVRYFNQSLSGEYEIVAKNDLQFSEGFSIDFYTYPKLEVVEIPAGKFYIGTENGIFDERPKREITITRPFEMSKFEVSQFLWKAIDNGSTYFKSSRVRPVSGISWKKATEFCNKLSEIWGLEPAYTFSEGEVSFDFNANGWRLPTEAEWEYAAKAGSDSDYFGFESPSKHAWYANNSGYNIQPIGLLEPNSFGLYDILGNLEEWVWDFYSDESYALISEIDPTGVNEGEVRVSRGGSYKFGISRVRTTSRNADNDFSTKGLRIVRNID